MQLEDPANLRGRCLGSLHNKMQQGPERKQPARLGSALFRLPSPERDNSARENLLGQVPVSRVWSKGDD